MAGADSGEDAVGARNTIDDEVAVWSEGVEAGLGQTDAAVGGRKVLVGEGQMAVVASGSGWKLRVSAW